MINYCANYFAPLNNSRVPIKDIVIAFLGALSISMISKILTKYKKINT